jgi:mannosyltransferase
MLGEPDPSAGAALVREDRRSSMPIGNESDSCPGWATLPASSPRLHALAIGGVLLVAVALRCRGLAERSLWFDEAFSWRLASFSWAEMCECIPRDNHPPLYWLLLKAWMAVVGDSPVALRSLSAAFGVATVLGIYLFAREAFGTWQERTDNPADMARGMEIALLAAALVALSPFQVRYAWEARAYALGTALDALSSWALFCALRARSGRLGPWLLYGFFDTPHRSRQLTLAVSQPPPGP